MEYTTVRRMTIPIAIASGLLTFIIGTCLSSRVLAEEGADSSCSVSVRLSWIAPGDDDNTGTATEYDIRYSTSTITDSNWHLATQVDGAPTPQPEGTIETQIVTNLSLDSIYHFALKAADNAQNWSTLSNIATVYTGINHRAMAITDIPVIGSVSGDYANTHIDDNLYQVITEISSGKNPRKSYSMLEHRWQFNVTPGETYTYFVEAYRPNNSDNDNFAFEYSINGSEFFPLVTISNSIEQIYSATIPGHANGTILVRVIDTDHNSGQLSMDGVHIDYMYIESAGEAPPPDTIFVDNIYVTRVEDKPNSFYGLAQITVRDKSGDFAAGVTVSGCFSGPSNDCFLVETDHNGTAVFRSAIVKRPSDLWCFNIDDISNSNYIYDPAQNVEDSDCENTDVLARISDSPIGYTLGQNYPNPFNPRTEITFNLPDACETRMDIFNIMGQRIVSLINDNLDAGQHTAEWDGSSMASGVYFYRLEAGDYAESKKMVLLK